MRTPIDYPELPDDDNEKAQSNNQQQMTFAVLRDRVDAEKPVTEDMIKSAKLQLESAYSQQGNKVTTNTSLTRWTRKLFT